MSILSKHKSYTVSLHSSQNYVSVVVENFLNSEAIRSMNLQQLKALEESGYKLLYNDFTKLKVVSPEDQEWIIKNFFPAAERLGLQRIAFLRPRNVFGELAMEKVNTNAVGNILMADFYEEEKAIQWLTS